MNRGRPVQREKGEQQHGVELLTRLGAKVYVSGTRRKKGDYQGTMQTPGIPDVEAWLPPPPDTDTRVEGPLRYVLKWECKAAGGRLSSDQTIYRQLCLDAGVSHVVGDFNALIAWLVDAGYVKAASFPHYRQPATRVGVSANQL